jgi:ATP-binding protein involved in chromosome partitioning
VIDPRRAVVRERLAGIDRIVAFCSAKGGVGKTVCTCISALCLASAGRKVGILDLDFQGASTHTVLGVEARFPEEKEGILPLPVGDAVYLMSAAAFTREAALPLRGPDMTNAMLELIAVTRWGRLDYLLIDMPPGIGDGLLDLLAFVPRSEALVVSTPSVVSVSVVERLLRLLAGTPVTVDGVIANMSSADSHAVRDMAFRAGVPFAGEVPLEPGLEELIGRPGALGGTAMAGALCQALSRAGIT